MDWSYCPGWMCTLVQITSDCPLSLSVLKTNLLLLVWPLASFGTRYLDKYWCTDLELWVSRKGPQKSLIAVFPHRLNQEPCSVTSLAREIAADTSGVSAFARVNPRCGKGSWFRFILMKYQKSQVPK